MDRAQDQLPAVTVLPLNSQGLKDGGDGVLVVSHPRILG